jgi:uncharacterized protein
MLGGIVMNGVSQGPSGLRSLGRRLLDPRRIAARWWAVILLLYPLVTLAAAAAALVLRTEALPLDLPGAVSRMADPASLALTMLFVLVIGPLPEEIGWRGFLLDQFQARWSALTASLLLAIVWWSWHLPLFALPGYFEAFARTPSPWDILYGILPSAVLYTWVYNNTGRSVLAVVILHFMENFTGEFLGVAQEVRTLRLALMVALVAVVVWFWGSRSLRLEGPA